MSDDPTLRSVAEATADLRKTIDAMKADGLPSAEQKTRFEKIELTLGAFDDFKSKLSDAQKDAKIASDAVDALKTDLEARNVKATEIEQHVQTLQAQLARGIDQKLNEDPEAHKKTDEYKNLNEYCRLGPRLDNEKAALLRTDQAVSGGVLVTGEMETFLTREVIELNPLRELARVRMIAGESISLPIRDTLPSASYEGQAELGPDSQGTYKSETVQPFRQHIAVPVTQQMLSDAAFDMTREITTDAELAFAVSEGTAFVNGSGFKEPKGFLQDTRIGTLASTATATGTIDGDDIIKLQGEIQDGYDPSMLFNRKTLAKLRILRAGSGFAADDGKGNYLWAPGLDGQARNSLGGMSYRIMPAMPDLTGGSKSVALGDWPRGYVIVDKRGVSLVRDDLTAAGQGIIKFTWNRYNTGQVVIPAAIKILLTKT